jgi:hypothetical protein
MLIVTDGGPPPHDDVPAVIYNAFETRTDCAAAATLVMSS